jgi:hypothetical protein
VLSDSIESQSRPSHSIKLVRKSVLNKDFLKHRSVINIKCDISPRSPKAALKSGDTSF